MNKLINISEGTSLAFHGLALIAEGSPERLNMKTVAERLSASEAHLAKVFQKLTRAGIVSSVRGPTGGFVIEKPAREITLLEIYEILEGPVDQGGCPLGREKCSFSRCMFEGKMNRISREIYEVLKNIRVSDFYQNHVPQTNA
jgi:Rrf2 family protein